MFPSPVGGIPSSIDLYPSLSFILLYALLLCIITYRMYLRTSRTILFLPSSIAVLTSLLFYAARLSNLVTPVVWWSANPMSWSELKLSVTYVLVAGDMLAFLRCLLVNSTYGSETYLQSPEWDTQYRSDKVEPQLAPPSANITDRARCRFVVRRVCDVLYIVSIASLVLGIITSGLYIHTTTNESTIRLVTRLRYAGTALSMTLIFATLGLSIWARNLKRIQGSTANLFIMLSTILLAIPLYRLSILHYQTSSLSSTEIGSQNQAPEKLLFYIFHSLSEWGVLLGMFYFNMRQITGAGYFGDSSWRDDSTETKLKRQQLYMKKAEERRRLSLLQMLECGKKSFEAITVAESKAEERKP